MKIILTELPKISINKWYSSTHWSHRTRIKNNYKLLIRSQKPNLLFKKDKQYNASYDFYFKSKPLDASNCSAMVKLIEDVLFEDDKWDVVRSITITSNKSNKELVVINVKEI